jgi:hypothetical protein
MMKDHDEGIMTKGWGVDGQSGLPCDVLRGIWRSIATATGLQMSFEEEMASPRGFEPRLLP